jgi:hypothetical protein
VVIDLETGRSLRRLSSHPSVRGKSGESGFAISVHGQTLAMPGAVGVDGIALSPDGKTLWWTPLSSYDFHSMATDVLADVTKSDVECARAVQTMPEREFASDGLDCDREGRVYFTDLTNDAISATFRRNDVMRRSCTTNASSGPTPSASDPIAYSTSPRASSTARLPSTAAPIFAKTHSRSTAWRATPIQPVINVTRRHRARSCVGLTPADLSGDPRKSASAVLSSR